MAKSRVKGITIQLGGDTTGLDKALKGVNENIRNTQSQLKDVERLLKLDPKNTVLLGQKQRLLAQATEETKKKLDQQKIALEQAVGNLDKYDAWAHANDKIQGEIDQTRDALKKLEKEKAKLDEAGQVDTDEYKKLTAEIEKTSGELTALRKRQAEVREEFGNPLSKEQFDGLQREIIETRLELEKLEKTSKVSLEQVSKGADKVAEAMKPATQVVAGLGAAAVATVPATEELREGLSRLDQNAQDSGVAAEAARAAWKEFAVQNGDTQAAIEATSNLLQAGFTESNLQKAVENLAGAANRFPDTLKVESLADSLQETLATGSATGQFAELLDRLGLSAEEFSASLAACTTDAERQDLALQTLANAGLADSYNAWKANNEEMVRNKEANLESQLAMAELAETVLPFVTLATEYLTKFLNAFNDLPEGAQKTIAALVLLVGAVSPVASGVSKAAELIDKLSGKNLPGLGTAAGKITGTVLPGLKTAFSTVFGWIAAHPVVVLIAAVVGLVALIATKGEEMIAFLNKIDDFLQKIFAQDWTEVFGPILGGALNDFFAVVKGVWDGIKSIFEGIINFIQGVFTGDWEQAWLGVRQIFSGIFEGLGTILKIPINSVIKMINKAIAGINWLIEGVNKIPGVDIGTIGQIPLLANGGEVLRGSAIVGEAGPELLTVLGDRTVVQPLSQTTNYHRANQWGGVNVYVYGAPGQDVRALADILLEEMQDRVDRAEAAIG